MKNSSKILEVKIERIVSGGFGLAFAEGLTIFVSLVVPEDFVRIRIDRIKKNVAFATLLEVIEPSKVRVIPRCEYFGVCGGCDFQQMSYEAQLEAKVSVIRDCLRRIGKINFLDEIPIIPCPNSFEYRTRAQFHLDVSTKKIGYFEPNSHLVCDVQNCAVLSPKMQETLTDFRQNITWEDLWETQNEVEFSTDGNQISRYSADIHNKIDELEFAVGKFKYVYNAETFFQGNLSLVEKLVDAAIGDFEGKWALDLYCGVGLFTLPLSAKFAKISGVEEHPKSIEFAKRNAFQITEAEVNFECAAVGDWLTQNLEMLENVDLVLLDPPRSGAEKTTIENLIEIQPNEISYVSCDAPTLARDLRILTENQYEIQKITAIDLFPQTHHVETIVHLRKAQ